MFFSDAPCMEYFPIFTIDLGQIVDIYIYSIPGAYMGFVVDFFTRSTKRVKGPALQRITTKAPALPVIACLWEAGLTKIGQESHSGKITIESIGNGPVNQDFVYYTICFSEGFSIFQPALHGNLCFLHLYVF